MGDLIIKPEAGGSIKLQNNAGTNALVSDNSGNVTLAGSTTISGGTISSAVTFPAGHVLQMKVLDMGMPNITGANGAWTGVSATDITVNRTSGTQLLFTLSGGGAYSSSAGQSIRTLGKRTSGSSFTGTEVALGDATQGNSRSYSGQAGVLHPHSSVAIDAESISGNYTYRWFYYGNSGAVDFSASDRGNVTVTIMEFKHS